MINFEVIPPVYNEENNFEPYFSYCDCDNCNTNLGGNRYDVTYRESLNGELYEATLCEDCFIGLCS